MRSLWLVPCLCGVVACGASATPREPTTARKAEAASSPAEPAPSAEHAATSAEPPPEPAQAGGAQVPLPASVEAGDIRRDALLAVLAQGPGRFLQRVRVKADRDAQGRFAGWRLLELFPGEAAAPRVIAPGDTVLRVNGQSVERPEQLKTVWDSLAMSSELVLTVRRGATQSDVRYRIVQ